MKIRTILILSGSALFAQLGACNHQPPLENNQPLQTTTANAVELVMIHGQVELAGSCGNTPRLSSNTCGAKPIATEVSIFHKKSGELLKKLETNNIGKFQVNLPLGSYRFVIEQTPFMSSAFQEIDVVTNVQRNVLLTVHAKLP